MQDSKKVLQQKSPDTKAKRPLKKQAIWENNPETDSLVAKEVWTNPVGLSAQWDFFQGSPSDASTSGARSSGVISSNDASQIPSAQPENDAIEDISSEDTGQYGADNTANSVYTEHIK